jgi:anti-sigma regulatory factor (Ser/Thr protein kinase)
MGVLVETSLTVPARATALDAIHNTLSEFWEAVDAAVERPLGDQWRNGFTIAVAEIASNIIRHAYPDVQESRDMHLRLSAYTDRVEARFVDHGIAWTVPTPTGAAPDHDLQEIPESGRGLAIARASLDELSYRRDATNQTNEWRLGKRFPAR